MIARVAVFASGTGTNLQALIDRLNGRASDRARVVLAVSDRPNAAALTRAGEAGLERRVVRTVGRHTDEIADETIAVLREHDIDLVALAGYLRLVPAEVVRRYRDRIINIHPALLPAFGGSGMYGTRVHRAVLDAGCLVTGVTVHHVDERFDEGRPIIQWPVPVLRGDSPERLGARVLEVEHIVYPLAIEWLAERLECSDYPAGTAPGAGQGTLASENIAPGLVATGAQTFELAETTDLEKQVRGVLGSIGRNG